MTDAELFSSLAGDDRPFLIQGDDTFTFDRLSRDAEQAYQRVQKTVDGKPASFLLEAENTYECYVKFLAALRGKWPVLLCPSYQFRSGAFRENLRNATGTDFFPCALGEPLRHDGPAAAQHPLLAAAAGNPVFLVRTSGSSGKSYKFIAHDFSNFLSYHHKNNPFFGRTFAFSPADSIAGIETLTEILAHRKTLVAPATKLSPKSVSDELARHEVDYFQTTPTFLNLMLLSHNVDAGKLPHLRHIAYGSEPPLRDSLEALARKLPSAILRQTYGMSEIGILLTTPCRDPSLVAFDQSRNPARLSREGGLAVRSEKQMLGYLNHESVFTPDGWFVTGDRAAQPQENLFQVFGRADDTINVAGRKFFPTELENLLVQLSNVADATVRREKNEFVGETIVAEFLLAEPEEEGAFRQRLKRFLEEAVPHFMHPHRVLLAAKTASSDRFKKMRQAGPDEL